MLIIRGPSSTRKAVSWLEASAGSRRRGSTVRALCMLDERSDVVQRKTRLEIAKIAGRYLEGLPSGGDARADQPPAQCFIDISRKERPTRRDSALSLAATSSSKVSVVRMS